MSAESWAYVSNDLKYRYLLGRRWAKDWSGPTATFIMLNPSTADADNDDPTIRRCIAFAKREGCTNLAVLNLYAYRATDPRELLTAEDPVGPENALHIAEHVSYTTGPVIAAWGAWHDNGRPFPTVLPARLLRRLQCLGTTKSGAPRHPLYVRGDQPLEPWTAA